MNALSSWTRLFGEARRALALALLCGLLSVAIAGCASSPKRARPTAYEAAATEHALYAYYRQWRGVPYRYGGRDTNGIDCSSFARQTLAAVASVDLPRTTDAQAEHGFRVDRAELSAGDLVFFKTGFWGGRHVGVYISNGRFMHASTSEGVTISRLDNSYWSDHYWQSRRVNASAVPIT